MHTSCPLGRKERQRLTVSDLRADRTQVSPLDFLFRSLPSDFINSNDIIGTASFQDIGEHDMDTDIEAL